MSVSMVQIHTLAKLKTVINMSDNTDKKGVPVPNKLEQYKKDLIEYLQKERYYPENTDWRQGFNVAIMTAISHITGEN